MTNEEAIEEIEKWLDGCPFEDTKEAFILAIKALEETPQGDLISRIYVCPFCAHKIQVTEQLLPKVTECEVFGAYMRGNNMNNTCEGCIHNMGNYPGADDIYCEYIEDYINNTRCEYYEEDKNNG